VNHDEVAALLEAATTPERPGATLLGRLERAEDRQAIRDLIMAYGYLEDARRWDAMLALYTDDIERVLAGSLIETVRGKAALRERLVTPVMATTSGAASASREQVEQLGLRHLMFSDVIRVSDDGRTATAAVQYILVATRDDGGLADHRRRSRSRQRRPGTAEDSDGYRRGSHEGSYVFDVRKSDGTWRFCRQLIVTNNAHNPMFRA
jgi:ketosteroid isomerase-like protein